MTPESFLSDFRESSYYNGHPCTDVFDYPPESPFNAFRHITINKIVHFLIVTCQNPCFTSI